MRLALATALLNPLAKPSLLLAQLLSSLIEADARYRETRKLLDLPEERLRDMGLTRPAQVVRHSALRGDWI